MESGVPWSSAKRRRSGPISRACGVLSVNGFLFFLYGTSRLFKSRKAMHKLTPIIPAFGRLRQEDHHEFEARLD